MRANSCHQPLLTLVPIDGKISMVFLLLLFPRISHQKQYAVSKGRCYGKEKEMVVLLDSKSTNSHTSIYPPSQSRWVDILCYSAEFPQIVRYSCQSARCKRPLCAWKIRFCVRSTEGARVATHTWMPSSSKYTEEQSVTIFTMQRVSLHFICTT